MLRRPTPVSNSLHECFPCLALNKHTRLSHEQEMFSVRAGCLWSGCGGTAAKHSSQLLFCPKEEAQDSGLRHTEVIVARTKSWLSDQDK